MKISISAIIIFSILLVSCGSPKSVSGKKTPVEGHWKLSYIADAAASKEFMSSRKPVISFSGNQISGNTNCNNFAGTLNLEGKKINFRDSNLAVTMIACEGKGEGAFMTALNRVDHYKLSDNGQTLQFLNGQTVELGFEKQ